MRKHYLFVVLFWFGMLGLSACTPPNTTPTISQAESVLIIQNTLAVPEEKTVNFTVGDTEDTVAKLVVSTTSSNPELVTLTNPSCNETGQCALKITVTKTTIADFSVTLSVKDTKTAQASSTFTIAVAPEEKTFATGKEMKDFLETAPAGASLQMTNTTPVLLDTQIILDKELTLWGLGLEQTILDAQSLDRLFWIKPTGKVILRDLTLTNGNAKDAGSTIEGDRVGGAIFNEGTLTLEKVRIINSKALNGTGDSKGKGGGIYTFTTGKTTLTESIIGQENNSNIATNSGGGLFNDGGILEVVQSQVSFNKGELRGGGIFNFRQGELRVQSSTLFNNFSEDGTAIKNEEGFVVIRESTLEKNIGTKLEGGAIVNLRGQLELYDSMLKNNETLVGSGGAIYNGATSTMLLDNTVLEGNKAARAGGAIYNETGSGLLELRNGSKVINNRAAEHGGGIYNAGTLKISPDCQISANSANTSRSSFVGGGIFNAGTLTDTPETVLEQVVTMNQPDNVFTPPPLLMAFYKTLYKAR